MKLVVGLGNPGQKYIDTRHNIWFIALDAFVQAECLWTFSYDNKFAAEVLIANIKMNKDSEKIIFLKPMLFMNKSGGPVQQVANFYKIDSEDILVLHDEIDHELGSVKLKVGGGHAWHNGLRDIIAQIWKDFSRIRIWVGRPANKDDVSEYVLWKFSKKEKEVLENLFPVVFDKIWEWFI